MVNRITGDKAKNNEWNQTWQIHYADGRWQWCNKIDIKYCIVDIWKIETVDGFRYIKELLLHNHNFHMNESYEKLKANNINVCALLRMMPSLSLKGCQKPQECIRLFGRHKGLESWRRQGKAHCWRNNEIPPMPVYTPEWKEIEVLEDNWGTRTTCKETLYQEKRTLWKIHGLTASPSLN